MLLQMRDGGIFLRTKSLPILPSQKQHRFFHSKPDQLITAVCTKIRQDFLASHHKHAQSQSLININHVLIYLNGNLSLWGKKTNGNFDEIETLGTPALEKQYNVLKSIPHLGIWLDLILQSIIDEKEKSLVHQKDLWDLKESVLSLRSLDDVSLQKELPVLDQVMRAIDKALFAKTTEQVQCVQAQFLQEIRKTNERYSAQATELQLNGLHQMTGKWIKQEGVQLEKSRILIVTSHGPREDLIEKQFFLDLCLKSGIVDAENKTGHLICVEMLPEQMATVTQPSLIDFLKKQEINRQIGRHLLDDSNGMNKDILGQYAPPVLERLCPFYSKKNHALLKNAPPVEEKSNPKGWLSF
jgi:hypothetical protein